MYISYILSTTSLDFYNKGTTSSRYKTTQPNSSFQTDSQSFVTFSCKILLHSHLITTNPGAITLTGQELTIFTCAIFQGYIPLYMYSVTRELFLWTTTDTSRLGTLLSKLQTQETLLQVLNYSVFHKTSFRFRKVLFFAYFTTARVKYFLVCYDFSDHVTVS